MGNGGREHALLWKLHRDAPNATFFATHPNPGMAPLCEGVALAPTDVEAISGWAAGHRIDLVVVGPEAPLAAGLVDRLHAKGIAAFGPTQKAARIESSKAYAKELMRGAGIPTAEHRTFSNASAAHDWVREMGAPIVVKADGLAAGKGAIVCESEEDAIEAIDTMLSDMTFGEAGRRVVVEEFMEGEEVSLFAVSDGRRFVVLSPAQDHKRVGVGDTGPNTGGMGAYAPVTIADEATLAEASERVLGPTLTALAKDGSPFRGFLYAGLMKTADGLKVVEFNCRFGDPEAQVVLPLLDSSLLDMMRTVADGGDVSRHQPRFRSGAAVTTVLASGGYPGSYDKGKRIDLPDHIPADVTVFHAGTALDSTGQLVTAGGRVLAVTALAPTVAEAAAASRDSAAEIEFEGAFFRSDIGWRELARSGAS